jgi:hypothetical protein
MVIKNHAKKSHLRTIEIDGYNLQQINDLMDAGKVDSFDLFVNEALSAHLLRVNNFYAQYEVAKTEKKEKIEKYNSDSNDRGIYQWKNQDEFRIDMRQYILKYPDILRPFEEKFGHKISNLEKFLDYFVPIAWDELQKEEAENEKKIRDEWSNLPDHEDYL